MAQVSRSVPLDCKSFTFTSSSGDRVYARDLADASAHGIAGDEQMVEDFGEEQELLAESARALIAAAKAYRNENRLQKELDQFQVQRPMDDVADDSVASGDGDVHDAPQDGGDGGRNVEASDLWVDKYSPKTFSELLSSERINREVLKWVKMWDPIVFGKTSRDNAATAKSPNPKIILLSGPPGAGKTTLAHVVARHAGYHPLEINTSDIRTGKALTQRLIDAMQMRSLFGDQRPNCIILDEIDGSLASECSGAVSALTQLIAATEASERAAAKSTAIGGLVSSRQPQGKAGKKKAILTRPIICICNDVFATSLRALRPVARVFRFYETKTERLVSRLKFICRQEQLIVRSDVLSTLCNRSENDIRSCLNSLQFLAAHMGNSVISVDDLAKHDVGHKDVKSSLFTVWQSIFSAKSERIAKVSTMRGKAASSKLSSTSGAFSAVNALSKRAQSVVSISGSHLHEVSKVLDGVFENYHKVQYTDPGLEKTNEALAWMLFGESCAARVRAEQQFAMLRYVPYIFAGLNSEIGSNHKTKAEYPRAQARLRSSKQERLSWIEVMKLKNHAQQCDTIWASQMISPIVEISMPHFRPVSESLLSGNEKVLLRETAGVLFSLGCKYSLNAEKHELELDPALPRFTNYFTTSDEMALLRSTFPNVNFEKMRRKAVQQQHVHLLTRKMNELVVKKRAASEKSLNQTAGPQSPTPASSSPTKLKSPASTPASAVGSEAAVGTAEILPKDFFGRPILKRKHAANDESGGDQGNDSDASLVQKRRRKIIFEYVPGFTNAVRRPMHMSDFI